MKSCLKNNMESAIKLDRFALNELNVKNNISAIKDYDMVYVGEEYCENLLTHDVLDDVIFFLGKNKKVCLILPPLSEKGVVFVSELLPEIFSKINNKKIDPKKFEITINDFSVLEILDACGNIPFKINLGINLCSNFMIVEANSMLYPFYLKYFLKHSIRRYEMFISNILVKKSIVSSMSRGIMKKENINLTMYYPYTNITTSRVCPIGTENIAFGDSVRELNCKKQCLSGLYVLNNQKIVEDIIVKGNSIFTKTEKIPDNEKMKKLRIDRLVYCPFP